MELQWVLQQNNNSNEISQLANQLHVPDIIANILLNKGIDSLDKAKYFFRASFEDLHDPYEFHQMEKAVNRIVCAVQNREKVLIYGDYDVDGITSVSLLYMFFQSIGCDVTFYIPNRLVEGYGISDTGIQDAYQKGVTLLISVDCGITAIDEVNAANELGIDIIISDHHEPGAQLPSAYAIINPKCDEANYPFHELAGVGVAYKLLQAISRHLKIDEQETLGYLDLVAIGSAADIVPLVDENRILMREGLRLINDTNRIGLQALMETAGIQNKQIGTGQIVFMLAPRINAVGRLGNAERAVRLLTTTNETQARNIAKILESENRTRKNIDETTFKEALEMVESHYDIHENKALVLDSEGWHSGVIGIVASRIVEKYYRPTVMITIEDGVGKGSARSISGFDIYSALSKCADLLLGFGGHKYAAGLTIDKDKIDALRERLNEIANDELNDDQLIPKLYIDDEIELTAIDSKLMTLLKMMAPYGPQNMRPVFLSRNLQVIGSPYIVGKNHLKFKVRQNGKVIDAIGFNLGDKLYRISPGEQNLDIVYIIEENEYMGRTTLQLRVKDLR
ncbi:single-stranded-DNA-specific exonuclease RecJ [candidate division KSB1 bacterium]|nr:single-stranded-DNA-specific exonuclease RecJ [candidate division KSB1 bacterium]